MLKVPCLFCVSIFVPSYKIRRFGLTEQFCFGVVMLSPSDGRRKRKQLTNERIWRNSHQTAPLCKLMNAAFTWGTFWQEGKAKDAERDHPFRFLFWIRIFRFYFLCLTNKAKCGKINMSLFIKIFEYTNITKSEYLSLSFCNTLY